MSRCRGSRAGRKAGRGRRCVSRTAAGCTGRPRIRTPPPRTSPSYDSTAWRTTHPARLMTDLAVPHGVDFAAELGHSVASLALSRAGQAGHTGEWPAWGWEWEQRVVDGHPYHPSCRSRPGFSVAEQFAYGPEHRPLVRAGAAAGPGGRVPGDGGVAGRHAGRGAAVGPGASVAGGACAEADRATRCSTAHPLMSLRTLAVPGRTARQDRAERPADVLGAGHLGLLDLTVGDVVGLRGVAGGPRGRTAARHPHAGRGHGRLARSRGRAAGVAADVRLDRRAASGCCRWPRSPPPRCPIPRLARRLHPPRPHRRPAAAGAGRGPGGARPEPPGRAVRRRVPRCDWSTATSPTSASARRGWPGTASRSRSCPDGSSRTT